jgi:hypothetical protein
MYLAETIDMHTNIWRYEYKYFVTNAELASLRSILSSIMMHDPGNGNDRTYQVNSLYFDNIDRQDELEKMSGIKSRKKIRLRYYNDFSTFKLEIKYRNDLLINKKSTRIDLNDAKKLVSGNIPNPFNNSLSPYLSIISAEARKPLVVVCYDREAYTLPYNNIRVTFDTNVASYGSNTNIFDENVKTPVFLDNRQILEVKFNHFLPHYIKSALSSIISERFAISKYAYSLRFSKNQQWEDI